MSDNCDDKCGPVSNAGLDLRTSFEIGAKLLVVMTVVVILSAGLVACALFFIYMCFLHPEAANSIVSVVIPTAMTAIAGLYGKKVVNILTNKNEPKEIEKSQK